LVAGFASTVFIPVTQGLIELFGWRGALIGLALGNLVIAVPIHTFLLRGGGGGFLFFKNVRGIFFLKPMQFCLINICYFLICIK
jgi:hypothetical protein